MPAAVAIPSLNGIRAVPLVSPTGPRAAVTMLTRRLAGGDEAAFREFHALYFDRLYHFLLIVTRGQAHAAQDALQETLLRVVRHAREFETEEAFWGWLQVIARNAARDGGRKHRRYFALLERFSFGLIPAASGPPHDDGGIGVLLDEALAEIDPAERALIEAKYIQGETVAELAHQSGLTEKAVESRLLRLRRHLAASLLQKLRRS